MDRRGVLGSAVGLAVTALLPHGVATAGRITDDDVTQSWAALRRLEQMDEHQGAAAVHQLAEGMVQRLQNALRNGQYESSAGQELNHVTAAATDQAGWFMHDAGFGQRARYWWLETCHLADRTDIPEARISAMTTMTLQAIENRGSGREALDLAQTATAAAQHSGTGTGTPKLLSLLAAREAVGLAQAQAGDHSGAMAAIARARNWLDQDERADDFFWLGFYGPADLAWHETRVALLLRDGKLAETSARAALATVDATQFPRNQLLYTVGLGSVLTRVGQLDEAINVTGRAVHGVHTIRGSHRALSTLRNTVDLLGRQNYPPAKTFATAAHRLLPAAA